MNQKEAINRWKESARDDLLTAEALYRTKRFMHCLFFCQMVLEKFIKALYIKKKNDAPPIMHNLLQLFRKTGEVLPPEYGDDFDEISGFNIEARYDIYKQKLYKKATKEFAKTYLRKTKEYMLWLEKKI